MSYTSRETSPDPLAGPSSPMASRIIQTDPSEKAMARPQRRSSRPLSARSHNIGSPSKSFVMDTGAAGDASPWRIKVTVEAEPHDGSSPSKKGTRTMKVPLKGSSSPAKKSPSKKALAADESEVEIKRPQRKRKGTPIRRNVKRASPSHDIDDEDTGVSARPSGGIEMSQRLQHELSSPTKAPITRSKRKGTPQPSPAERARRLAKAQAQLESLRSSADSDAESHAPGDDAEVLQSDAAPGDVTVANEDFTMISVATLESMKQGNTSLLLDNSGIGEKSTASVSYMPSSPPQTRQVQDESFSGGGNDEVPERGDYKVKQRSANPYDDMSWKPTGPSKTASMLARSNKAQKDPRLYSESDEYQREREAVSRQIENASADQVVVIDSSHASLSSSHSSEADEEQAVLGAEQSVEGDDDEEGGGEDDIWAEEASRSLEEEQQDPQPPQSSAAAALNELFSDQASKPPRSKIPRTWRRTSGMDFSYVDSPAHEVLERPTTETRKVSATSTVSSKEGEGVLTPPDSSFDEDDGKPEQSAEQDQVDVDLTHPDAAATQLQVEEEPIPRRRPEPERRAPIRPARRNRDKAQGRTRPPLESSFASNLLRSNASGNSSGSNEDEDGGNFWQSNLPSVFQKERQRKWGSKLLAERKNRARTNDLSEILKSSSDVSMDSKPSEKISSIAEKSEDEVVVEKASSRLQHVPKGTEKVVDSPLRKSLLKSSKIGGNSLPNVADSPAIGLTSKLKNMHMPGSSSSSEVSRSVHESSFDESFESKASDQRQLLTEMNTGSATSSRRPQQEYEDETDLWGAASEEQSEQHPMSEASYAGSSPASRSRYAEPQDKDDAVQADEDEDVIDSIEEDDSKHPAYSYEEHLNLDSPVKIKVKFNDSEGNSSVLAPKKVYPRLFGKQDQSSERIMVPKQAAIRADTADQGPGIISRLTTTIWSALVRPTGPTMVEPATEPAFSPSLRTQIRERYGVLSDQHPFTMAHMRTLHRLLNSCLVGKSDCLVPNGEPLPAPLKALVGKELQCITDFKWKFTAQHAHVVDAFMQTLVPAHYIEAMKKGEVEFLGDDFSLQYRGEWAGRHGDDLVWDDETIEYFPILRNAKGRIERSFVVSAVGNAVSANIETAEREGKEKEERVRIEAERRAWERRMGVVHDEVEEGEGSTEELSTLESSEVEQRGRRRER